MWQQSDELTKVLERKLNGYFDQPKETLTVPTKIPNFNNLTDSNLSFGGSGRPQQSPQTDRTPQNRYAIQVFPNSDNSTNYSNASPSKLESFLSSRYQIKNPGDITVSKYTFSTRQNTEATPIQTEPTQKFTSANTRTSIDFRYSEDSLPIPRPSSRGESLQTNKPELLTQRSLLSLRREKVSSSPASQMPLKNPMRFDHMNTDNVSDNFELASQFSLVFSDKPTEPQDSEKQELHLLNETNGHQNLEAIAAQQPGSIGLWKMESVRSNKSQTQKFKMQMPQEGPTDVMNIKRFLLGPGTSGENSSRNSSVQMQQKSLVDSPAFLDAQFLQTNTNSRGSYGDFAKRSFTYNVDKIMEANTLNVPYSTQGSQASESQAQTQAQKFTRSLNKAATTMEKDTKSRPPLLSKLTTINEKQIPRLIIQSPSNLSPQTKYMNSLMKKSPKGEKEKEKKRVFENIKVSVKDLVYAMIIIKRRLRIRYLKNRKEVYKYEMKDDPPAIKVVNRNKELVRKRNQYCKEDKKFRERELVEIQETSKIEYFDQSGFSSLFSTKSTAPIPANGNDPQSGKVVKSGFVRKITNKTKVHHQKWIVLRSFNVYWYKSTFSSQPKGIVPLTTAPIKEIFIDDTRMACMVVEQPRGRDFIFLSDNSWKVALMNEIAFKSYMEYMRENHIIPRTGIIEYFENEGYRTLDLSECEFNDTQLSKVIYESLAFHPKLKELNLAKTNVRGKQLEDLMTILINLKKHSKLETLNLDSNNINKESISHMTRYLESESSFNLKRFSLSDNPIGEDGIQVFMENILSRFEKMNVDNRNKLILPFSELDLSGTRLGDQSIFTLITVFDQINKRFGDRGVEDHRDLISMKLSDNLISDNGLRALAKALTKFHGLNELYLSNNPRLTGVSFTCLLTHLKKSSSISKLEYKKNAIDIKGLGSLFSNLADNFLLKRLSITLDEKLIEAFIGNEEVTMDFYKIMSENKF